MDNALFDLINDDFEPRTAWAHHGMTLYAKDGVVLFALLLVCGWVLSRHRRDLAGVARSWWAGAAALVALGIAQVIGKIVRRARPYDTLHHVHLLVARTNDFSFPSDHATVVGAVAVGLYFVDRRVGLVAGAAALLMAFTRVYVGAHYPLDVLAGLALGGTMSIAGQRLIVPTLGRAIDRLAGSPLHWLVASADTGEPPAPDQHRLPRP